MCYGTRDRLHFVISATEERGESGKHDIALARCAFLLGRAARLLDRVEVGVDCIFLRNGVSHLSEGDNGVGAGGVTATTGGGAWSRRESIKIFVPNCTRVIAGIGVNPE